MVATSFGDLVSVGSVLAHRFGAFLLCDSKIPLACSAVKHYPASMKKPIPELSKYFSAMGKKGSKARAKKLSPEERREIATKAAEARWAKREGRNGR